MKKIFGLLIAVCATTSFAFPHSLEERVDDLEKQVDTLRKMVVELISDPSPEYDGVVRGGAYLYTINGDAKNVTNISGSPQTERKEFYIVEEISNGIKHYLLVRFRQGEAPTVIRKSDTIIYKKD